MKIKNQILSFIAILAVALTTFSCTSDSPKEVTPLKSILAIAQADPANFSILLDALKKTSLDATLGNAGSYTVFAPTNAAFTAAGITSASIALMTPAQVADLKVTLQNHVIGVGTRANDLLTAGYTRTFGFLRATSTATSGANLSVFANTVGGNVLLNGGTANGGAKVVTADIQASNGILHVIDGVLKLPTIVDHIKANPSLSSLLGVVTSSAQAGVLTDLTAATGSVPVTVYAPNNDAFTTASTYLTGRTDAQVTNILRYHLEKSNRLSSSATSFTSSSATADVSVTTLYKAPADTKFTILLGTVKIKDVIGTTNANIKITNIQGTNGVVQVIDKVLQPFL
ncbi:fasciclin domain-containing protein [Flavobacterium sp.]|uniref:fasciclin domain-containing protein n=1 Tax=Flavobacterium sp. TaxID=239 RepID=UPI00262A0AB2|nr:fasciclin domain-containing protein [Flavobacterium sp.]MDG2433517.1 fasciclin domain-containing protein [Flavobacterium sp.]